jgi:hypothetical protein
MTVGRDQLSKAETVTVAAIESGVEALVEAREAVVAFQTMIRQRALAELEPWIERAREPALLHHRQAPYMPIFVSEVGKFHAISDANPTSPP